MKDELSWVIWECSSLCLVPQPHPSCSWNGHILTPANAPVCVCAESGCSDCPRGLTNKGIIPPNANWRHHGLVSFKCNHHLKSENSGNTGNALLPGLQGGGLSHCPSRDLSSLSFFYLFQHPRECFRNSLLICPLLFEAGWCCWRSSSFSTHAKQQALNK